MWLALTEWGQALFGGRGGGERRSKARRPVAPILVLVGHGGRERAARLRNVTSLGLMAEGDVGAVPGLRVKLRSVALTAEGIVVWTRDSTFGVQFDSPIPEAGEGAARTSGLQLLTL